MFGSTCLYSHVLTSDSSDASFTKKEDNELSDDGICQFYLQGACRYGDDCHFVHLRLDKPEDQPPPFDPKGPPCFFCEDIAPECGYGLQNACECAVCFDCIMSHRSQLDENSNFINQCPSCEISSSFVVAYEEYVLGEQKEQVIANYKKSLRDAPCGYFNSPAGCPFGDDECPFGQHTLQTSAIDESWQLIEDYNQDQDAPSADLAELSFKAADEDEDEQVDGQGQASQRPSSSALPIGMSTPQGRTRAPQARSPSNAVAGFPNSPRRGSVGGGVDESDADSTAAAKSSASTKVDSPVLTASGSLEMSQSEEQTFNQDMYSWMDKSQNMSWADLVDEQELFEEQDAEYEDFINQHDSN